MDHSIWVSTYTLQEVPLAEAVDRLLAQGWKGIEIMGEGPHGEILQWGKKELERLRQRLRETGAEVSLHAPITGLNPAARGRLEAEAAMNCGLRALETAMLLNCPYMVLHPGELDPKEAAGLARVEAAKDRDFGGAGAKTEPVRTSGLAEAEERVAGFVLDLLEKSGEGPTAIALENTPPYPGLLGTDAAFLGGVLDRVPSPRIKAVFDTGHSHMTGARSWQMFIERLAPRLALVHFSDNHGTEDEHLRLGWGTVPLDDLWADLKGRGWSGILVCENRAPEDAWASAVLLDKLTN